MLYTQSLFTVKFYNESPTAPKALLIKTFLNSYSLSTSTGTLKFHLNEKHHLNIELDKPKKNRKIDEIFKRDPKRSKPNPNTNDQYIHAREIVLWFCTDLIPFYAVEGEGFKHYCMQHGISNLPSRTTLSYTALEDVCRQVKAEILVKTSDIPGRANITLDLWTDGYKRRSYITYTLHFIDSSFKIQTMSLQTEEFPGRHTANEICNKLTQVLQEFNIDPSKVDAVSDGGRNVVKSLELAKIRRHYCFAHGIHNLLMVDLLESKPLASVRELLQIIRKTHQALIYKKSDLELNFEKSRLAKFVAALAKIEEIGNYS